MKLTALTNRTVLKLSKVHGRLRSYVNLIAGSMWYSTSYEEIVQTEIGKEKESKKSERVEVSDSLQRSCIDSYKMKEIRN